MSMLLSLPTGLLLLFAAQAMLRRYWSFYCMVNSKGIQVVQRTKYRWDIVAIPRGHTMIEGLYFPSARHAGDWAKAYTSSWPAWTYELVLKEGA